MSEEQVTDDVVESPESKQEPIDLYSMTDEEINQMIAPPSFNSENEKKEDEQNVSEEETEEESTPESSETDETVEEKQEEQETVEASAEENTDAYDSSVEDTSTNEALDYEKQYKEALAPLRANGKDITLNSIEELRRLAQQGIGFNANMAKLKPVRKIAKMLENENLLDENKVNYLIDLSKGNTDAINKLIKDSKIDPLDLDRESTKEYVPNTYTVADSQLNLDETLAELKQSPTYQQTIEIVGNRWDEKSREELVSNPRMITELDKHVQAGIFNKVNTVLEKEKLLGNLPIGISDLQAYNMIGERMHAAGQFKSQPAPDSKPNINQDAQRKARKKAASSPTKSKKVATPTEVDVFALTDEEFEKMMPKYL